MVLAASIVGSGELIATTTLGAQVGFAALWIILASCAIKPVVQAELGRYTIATGETGLEGFNRVPGPRAGVSWVVWAWALTVTLTLLQVGGMFGGVAQVLHLACRPCRSALWVGICLAMTLALLLGGGYERIERFAIVKVGLFTLLTVCAAAVLFRRENAVTAADLAHGLSFAAAGGGPRHGGRGLRHHRRRRHRAGDVSRTGASRRATRASPVRPTAARRGSRARAAGFA